MIENNINKTEINVILFNFPEGTVDLNPLIDTTHKGLLYVGDKLGKPIVDTSETLLLRFKDLVDSKCSAIPETNRIPPNMRIAKGVLENVINLEAHETTLQEMFANLLAGSMDNRKSDGIHPSYAKIISELSEEDARFLKILNQERMVLFLIVYDLNENKSHYVYKDTLNYSNIDNPGLIFDTVIHQGLISQNSIHQKESYSIDILNEAVKWFNETEPSTLNTLNIVDRKNVSINRYLMELSIKGQHFMKAVTLKESPTDEKS